MDIGSLLKKIRTDQRRTLSDVAQAVSLTPSSLSQIENSKISPSISTLEAVLGFYRVPVSDFFRQIEQTSIIITKHEDVESIETAKGVFVSLLASKLEHNTLESYKVTLLPDNSINIKQLPPEKNGERFLIVIEGSVTSVIDSKDYIFRKGDSVNFKSHIPCSVKNDSGAPCEFFINGTPSIL
jgi:transcriptional regulator with XRE-family HTH domain